MLARAEALRLPKAVQTHTGFVIALLGILVHLAEHHKSFAFELPHLCPVSVLSILILRLLGLIKHDLPLTILLGSPETR